MEQNSKMFLGFIIGILFMLVIGMGGFIVYDKFLKNNNSENNEQQKEIEEVLDVNSELVQSLYSYTNTFCENYRRIFYENDKLVMNEMKNQDKLYLGLSYMFIPISRSDEFDDDANWMNISLEKFEESMKKIFGSNISYIKETVTGVPYMEFNNYEVSIGYGSGCGMGAEYNREVVSARKYNDRIEIDEKHVFLVSGLGSDGGQGVFEEYTQNFENPIGIEAYSDSKLNGIIKKYENILPTYRFTYNNDGQGNYYLYSVEKVK